MTKRRILWMKGGALGDFILGLPVLSALRTAYPDDWIDAIGPKAWLPLATGWADTLVPLELPCWSSLYGDGEGLPASLEMCDLALILRPDTQGVLKKNLLAAGVRQVLVHSPVPAPQTHQVDHLRESLIPLGIPSDPWPSVLHPQTRPSRVGKDGLYLPSVHRMVEAPSRRLHAAGSGRPPRRVYHGRAEGSGRKDARIFIHPGSGGVRKQWPAENFLQLAEWLRKVGETVTILLGPAEIERGANAFWRGLGLKMLESPPIWTLAGWLRTARLFVGNDSGTGHLAAALSCPTLVLFGPSDPAVWAPRGPRVKVVSARKGGHSPDQGTGELSMRDIRLETVKKAIEEFLEDSE